MPDVGSRYRCGELRPHEHSDINGCEHLFLHRVRCRHCNALYAYTNARRVLIAFLGGKTDMNDNLTRFHLADLGDGCVTMV